MKRLALAVLLVLAALAVTGCVRKKNKPPPMKLVALGENRGCGQLVSGPAVCWGNANGRGQLGDGSQEGRLFPAPVAGELGKVRAFAFGVEHTCAVSEGGTLHCWGSNGYGQLGGATSAAESAIPVRVPGDGWDLVVAGRTHTCARGREGVRCWGSTGATVGLGAAAAPLSVPPFEPVALAGKRVATMAAAGDATCFAIELADAAHQEVRCFGFPFATGHDGVRFHEGAAVARMAMNAGHVCSVLANGELTCAAVPVPALRPLSPTTPTRIDLPEPVAEVGLGKEHACVRTRSGAIACWGDNRHHQLADGTSTPSDRPKPVYGLLGATQLAVADDGACALIDRGEVRCWGGNGSGQLGDGTTVEHDVPMPIKAAPR